MKALALCIILYVLSAPSFSGSANVKVTIKIPNVEQSTQAVRLYNYQLNRYQIIRNPFELTREQCLNYLPSDNQAVVKILDLHISKGRKPYKALVFTHLALRA